MTVPGGYIAGDVLTAANLNLLPGGKMGYAEVTADQSTITTVADLTSLTVTWTAVAARRYRLTFEGSLETSSAPSVNTVYITNSSNTAVATRAFSLAANASAGETPQWVGATVTLTGLSGSVTYKVRAAYTPDSVGSLTLKASATAPAYFLVEDIGPA